MTDAPAARSLEGKPVADAIHERVRSRVQSFRERTGRAPGLHVILVGEDPASQVYVRRKEEAAKATGMEGRTHRLGATTPHSAVLAAVAELNADDSVDGILVQLPLPRHVDSHAVLAGIDPAKDVDGFHPLNVGRLQLGLPACRPCTPAGVMKALEHHGVRLAGANAVVVGRSNIVGKPMAALLLAESATVTVCHSRTRDLPGTCRQADVLVVAAGIPGLVRADAVRPGATVIDVGINRLEKGRDDALAERLLGAGTPRHAKFLQSGNALVGDVDWLSVREVAGLLTPVPGGVGPLTIAMLLSNTVDAACRRLSLPLDPA